MLITDPVERVIADALDAAGIGYVHEAADPDYTDGLDFRLENDLYIECKQFHSPRATEQMARVANALLSDFIAHCEAPIVDLAFAQRAYDLALRTEMSVYTSRTSDFPSAPAFPI